MVKVRPIGGGGSRVLCFRPTVIVLKLKDHGVCFRGVLIFRVRGQEVLIRRDGILIAGLGPIGFGRAAAGDCQGQGYERLGRSRRGVSFHVSYLTSFGCGTLIVHAPVCPRDAMHSQGRTSRSDATPTDPQGFARDLL